MPYKRPAGEVEACHDRIAELLDQGLPNSIICTVITAEFHIHRKTAMGDINDVERLLQHTDQPEINAMEGCGALLHTLLAHAVMTKDPLVAAKVAVAYERIARMSGRHAVPTEPLSMPPGFTGHNRGSTPAEQARQTATRY